MRVNDGRRSHPHFQHPREDTLTRRMQVMIQKIKALRNNMAFNITAVIVLILAAFAIVVSVVGILESRRKNMPGREEF